MVIQGWVKRILLRRSVWRPNNVVLQCRCFMCRWTNFRHSLPMRCVLVRSTILSTSIRCLICWLSMIFRSWPVRWRLRMPSLIFSTICIFQGNSSSWLRINLLWSWRILSNVCWLVSNGVCRLSWCYLILIRRLRLSVTRRIVWVPRYRMRWSISWRTISMQMYVKLRVPSHHWLLMRRSWVRRWRFRWPKRFWRCMCSSLKRRLQSIIFVR